MPKVNDVVLSADGTALVVESIKTAGDSSMLGMRKSLDKQDASAEEVRSILLTYQGKPKELPSALITYLRERVKGCRLIGMFSEASLQRTHPAFIEILGRHAAGLAFALDERDGLHNIARVCFTAPGNILNIDFDKAAQSLADELAFAFEAVGYKIATWKPPGASRPTPLFAEGIGNESELSQNPECAAVFTKLVSDHNLLARKQEIDNLTPVLRKRISEQETKLTKLETALEAANVNHPLEIARLKAQHTQKELEFGNRTAELKTSLNTSDVALEKAVEANNELKRRLQLFEESQAAEIERRVNVEISTVMRPWLDEAGRLKQMSATRKDEELEEKVDAILRQQEALDLVYGSRTRLKNRLSQFTAYADKIRTVFEDSIAPHPGLEPLLRELEVEIRHLRRQLNIEERESPHFGKIVEAISRAASEESLKEIERAVDDLADKGVFSNREVTSFYRKLHVAYDRLALKNQEPSTKPRLRSGWELRNVLARNRPSTVYLDAHNVLLQMADCYGCHFIDGRITPNPHLSLVRGRGRHGKC